MNSGNWIIDNIMNALSVWNAKLQEIWLLITQSPESFKGGGIWNMVVSINGALKAIGFALLVLFFVVGVMKTCGSFAEIKRPEHAAKLFIRFIFAKAVVGYGLDLMMALFRIVQGIISTTINTAGLAAQTAVTMPAEMEAAIQALTFWQSIPAWAVSLIGSLVIIVLSFVMIMSVYGRFFKLYLYTAIAPILIRLCRRTLREHRQELPEIVCGSMSGGGYHRVRVYHFQRVCLKPACGGRELKPRHNGVGVHGRVNLQPACADGRGKDG